MAERVITWRAVADFARARREADRTKRSFEEMGKSEERLNRQSVEADQRAEQAEQKRTASIRERIQAMAKARAEGRRSAEETSKLAASDNAAAKASESHRRSLTAIVGSLGRRARASRDAAAADDELASSQRRTAAQSEALRRAQTALEQAVISRQRATLALESAQQRLSAVEKKSGKDSDNYAMQLTRVSRAHLEVEASSRRHSQAESRVADAMKKTDDSGGGLRRGLGNLVSGFGGAGRAALNFGTYLNLLKLPAIGAGIGVLISAVSQLSAGLVSLIGPLSSTVGLLAAAPQAATVFAGAMGTAVAAFAGISDAVGAGIEQQKAAGEAADAAAQAQEDAARRIADARRGLADAQRAAADTEEQSTDQIAEARKALADAEVEGARQIEDAQQGVQDARRAAAEGAEADAQAISDAEDSVVDAQRAAVDAQQELQDARESARDQLRDMRYELEDYALSEEGASISVARARQRLNEVLRDPGSTQLDIRESQLAYDEAMARQREVRREASDARDEYRDAQKKGVEGSDEVISARRSEQDALSNVADAQDALTEAQETASENQAESARAIEDAQQGVADAVEAAADQQQEAQKAVADAVEAAADAQKDAARAVADAQRNLRDAMQEQKDATAEATAEQDKFAQAMEDLSPAARRFVRLLIGMQDEVKSLRSAAQRGLLPGLGRALTTLTDLLPLAREGLFRFGRVMGNTAEDGANLATSGPFKKMFGRLLDSNVKILKSVGRSLINVGAAIVYIMDSARPFTRWLFRTVEGWTQFWRESAKAGNKSGKTADFLDRTRRVLVILGGALKNLYRTFKNIGKAGMGLGMDLLRSFRRITKGWANWTGSMKGQNQLKDWFDSARPTLHQISKLLGAVMRIFFDMGRSNNIAPLIKRLRTDLLPIVERVLNALQGKFANALVDALIEFARVIEHLTKGGGGGLIVFLKTLTALMKTFNWAARNIPGFNEAFGALLGFMAVLSALKFVGTITGISTLVKWLYKLGKTEDKLLKIKGFFTKISEWGGKALRFFGSIGRAIGTVGGWFLRLGKFISPLVRGVFPWLVRGLALVAAALGLPIEVIVAIIAALAIAAYFIVKYWDEIKAAFGKAVDWVVGFFKEHWDEVLGVLLGPLGLAIVGIIRHWDDIKAAFGAAKDWIIGLLKKAWSKIKDWILEPVADAAQWVWEKLKDLFGFFKDVGGDILDWVKDRWSDLKDLLGGPLEAAWKFMKPVWEKIKEGFDWVWDKVSAGAKSFKSWIGKLWDGIKGVFMAPVEFIVNKVIGDWMLGSLNKVLGWLEMETIPVPHIGGGGDKAPKMQPGQGRKRTSPGVTRARGGPIPGEGNQDSVSAELMPGEFVLRRNAVKRIGVSQLEAMNEDKHYRGRRFARGGPVRMKRGGGIPAEGTWSQHTSGYDWARWAGDINQPGSGDEGNPVRAYKPGVIASTQSWDYSYGNHIRMNHPATNERTLYAHLSSILTHAGAKVGRGQQIGKVGHTGNASGPHLHFEIAGGSDPLVIGGVPLASGASGLPPTLASILKKMKTGDSSVDAPGNSEWSNVAGNVAGKVWDSVKSWIVNALNPFGGGDAPAGFNAKAAGDAQRYAKSRLSHYGWGPDQFGPLKALWTHESNWMWNADNPSSSAYGIPQALPGSKMASEGPDWRTNYKTQVDWGLKYIKQRSDYGSPAAAWNLWQERDPHWYARGGPVPGRGERDTVPAMLTPGEFVLNKRAVKRLGGLGRLSKMNAQGQQPGVSMHGPVQHFHRGGPVLGMKRGGEGSWVHAIQHLLGWGSPSDDTDHWNARLDRQLRRKGARSLKDPKRPRPRRMKNFMDWVRAPDIERVTPDRTYEVKRKDTIRDILTRFYGTPTDRQLQKFLKANDLLQKRSVTKAREDDPKTKKKDESREREVEFSGKKHKFGDHLKVGSKVTVPNVETFLGARTWKDARKRFKMSDTELFGMMNAVRKRMKRSVGMNRREGLMTMFGNYSGRVSHWIKALNKKLGLKRDGDDWTNKGRRAMQHVLQHSFHRKHKDFEYRPWKDFTPLERAIMQQRKLTKQQQQWQDSLQTISGWGYENLVNDLFERGMEDGLRIARGAAKDKRLAGKLNAELKRSGTLSDEDFQSTIKMISFIMQGQGHGLRDIAQHMDLSDYEVFDLYQKAKKAKKFRSVPAGKLRKLETDVGRYRKGTFYAAQGGEVPGSGSGDTVPAMLEPGEFVMRKRAAEALGLDNLLAMNGLQKFAAGGLVMEPNVADFPRVNTAVGVARNSGGSGGFGNTYVTYDVDIHNPVAEKSTYSMNKYLQRRSTLKGFRKGEEAIG